MDADDLLIEELAALFGESASEAERMVRKKLKAHPGLNLQRLIDDFRKLSAARVVRQTPLIFLLEAELRDYEVGRGSPGVRRRFATIDEIEKRKTEPEYVYHGRKRSR